MPEKKAVATNCLFSLELHVQTRRNIICINWKLLTYQLLHSDSLDRGGIVRKLLVLVVRVSSRDNLARAYCVTSIRNQSLILSLVVRNINHVPILKRHEHCFAHNAGTRNRNGNKRRNEADRAACSLPRPPFSIRRLLPVFLSYAIPLSRAQGLRCWFYSHVKDISTDLNQRIVFPAMPSAFRNGRTRLPRHSFHFVWFSRIGESP